MPQCKLCKRSGWLLNTKPNGLCPACNPAYMIALKSHARVMQDCVRLIKESKNYKTRLGRCNIFIETASRLIQYEKLDIPTTNPLPSELVSQMQVRKAELIIEHEASRPSVPVEVPLRGASQTGVGRQSKQWGIAGFARGEVLCKKAGREKVVLIEPGGGWMCIDRDYGPDIQWIPKPSDGDIVSALLGIPVDQLSAVQEFCSVPRTRDQINDRFLSHGMPISVGASARHSGVRKRWLEPVHREVWATHQHLTIGAAGNACDLGGLPPKDRARSIGFSMPTLSLYQKGDVGRAPGCCNRSLRFIWPACFSWHRCSYGRNCRQV